jgi:hypothetical protein
MQYRSEQLRLGVLNGVVYSSTLRLFGEGVRVIALSLW